jgi:hypothetical protein|uniref:Uncharacterized protein n=1 Tax=Poterioochromonas malhamensis TaxID=88167 RepID=A0A7T6Y7X8_9STRA|nr:hypothetical protein KYW67_pgp127 [Poterioochromonas malhamensis]YP_010139409.1 hypothetical protein KYW67_pgp018 [Poterioochromonas malhamensis]QQK54966.1 hypothetical protein [Poterioochromonas malhamensis]QQK55075.1 hypothetical protein [Poterioochromonas malhamensis]
MVGQKLSEKQIRRLFRRLLEFYSSDYLCSLDYKQLVDLIMKLFGFYLCMDDVIEGIYPGSNFNQVKENWDKFIFFLKLLFGYWKAMAKREEFAKTFVLAAHVSGKLMVLSQLDKLSTLSLLTFLQRFNYLFDLDWRTWLLKQGILCGTFGFFSFQIYKYFVKRKNYFYLKKLQKKFATYTHGGSTLILLHLFLYIHALNERLKKKYSL